MRGLRGGAIPIRAKDTPVVSVRNTNDLDFLYRLIEGHSLIGDSDRIVVSTWRIPVRRLSPGRKYRRPDSGRDFQQAIFCGMASFFVDERFHCCHCERQCYYYDRVKIVPRALGTSKIQFTTIDVAQKQQSTSTMGGPCTRRQLITAR